MKKGKLFAAALVASFTVLGLSACEKKNEGAGPAETAGREIDQAAAKTNEKLGKAGEKISEDTSEFRKKVGEKMEQAGEKMQRAADKDANK